MTHQIEIVGLEKLWKQTRGNAQICVAVLDGSVDTAHSCLQNANLKTLPTLVQDQADAQDQMAVHGTHVASVIFGQPESSVPGIAPGCRGVLLPVFSDSRPLSQLDLSRAIEQAVNAGAHIINISGGQFSDEGSPEGWLENAVALCQNRNVLVVAAAGNDGCACLHVPAALPAVLAVGAMDRQGQPMAFSNWGEVYQQQGILALGEQILGAKPGGGVHALSGTSFATPIVAGIAALLLSLQIDQGREPDPEAVRAAILQTALPCEETLQSEKCLAGRLNVPALVELFTRGAMSEVAESSEISESVIAAGCGCGGVAAVSEAERDGAIAVAENAAIAPSQPEHGDRLSIASEVATDSAAVVQPSQSSSISQLSISSPSSSMTHSVTPSQAPSELVDSQLVYALGTLGYDFGSEARRDSFKQLMPAYSIGEVTVPANPYDARQLVDYLAVSPSEARSLIWTLNIELTPVYAIEPQGAYARDVYAALQELLAGQIQAESSEEYVERVSIPGVLTGRTVKLYSGQVVPVIAPQSPRGIYGWKVNSLVSAALETVQTTVEGASEEAMRRTLGSFLNRIYYDLRNLGTTSQDRALNFATTNAFQAASTFAEAVAEGMELDSITVEKSPFCRLDSDCWDVKLKFFDPENSRRAKKVFRFTIDVSDLIPVTLGEVRTWATPY